MSSMALIITPHMKVSLIGFIAGYSSMPASKTRDEFTIGGAGRR